MMLDLFDDGAHALDDGLGAVLEMIYLDDMMTYMMPWLLMRFPYHS